MNGTTMTEFLAEHSSIQLQIYYIPEIKEYRVDVYSTEYWRGKAKLQTFVYSNNMIDRLNVDFDTIIGNSLSEWWETMGYMVCRSNLVERVPSAVSVSDEALKFKDQKVGDAR